MDDPAAVANGNRPIHIARAMSQHPPPLPHEQDRPAPGLRGRGTIAVGTVGIVTLVLVLFSSPPNGLRPGQSASPVDLPAATASIATPAASAVAGPTVVYEVLGQGRLTLYERRLDGRSEPVELARRPAQEEGTGRFIVGPARESILFAQWVSGTSWTMEPISVTNPTSPPAWRLDVSAADFREGTWSPDGRFWAGYSSGESTSIALVVDATLGRSWQLPLRPAQYVQGFDGLGPSLIVREDELDQKGSPIGVRFEAVDPIDGRSRPIAVEDADAPPHSAISADAAPRAGLWVVPGPGLGKLLIGDLRTGERTTIDRVGTQFVYVGFLPAADRVLAFVTGTDDLGETQLTLRVVGVAGGARQLWQGLSCPLSVVFAPEGDIVGFYAWGDTGSRIVIVDTITGRSVDLPRPERTQFGGLLAIRGGVPLPIPAVPPVPTTTPVAPTPVPSLIAGTQRLVTASVEYDPVARSATVRVQLVGPAEGGRLAVIDEMEPVVLPRVRRSEPWVQLSPRPGTSSVVVTYGDDDSGNLVVWTPNGSGTRDGSVPGAEVEALPLPAGWPVRATGIAWRPDGKAIAVRDWGESGDILWYELDDLVLHRVAVPELWGDTIGWSADGGVIVLQHAVCTEGCPPPYSLLGAIRLKDGRFTPVTPSTPIDALAVGTAGASVRTGLVASGVEDGSKLEFSPGIGISGTFALDWPVGFGRLGTGFLPAAWSQDGRRLYVAVDTARGRELLRIDDPRAGVPLRPVSVGLVPPGAHPVEVDANEAWARTVGQSVDGCREGLVELRTGRSYLADCSGATGWFAAP